jgi:L-ascorbate metabolism protein UlaG (beta-lactamase superfamily)
MTLRITYVGHATVLVDMDGVRLLTDPVLRNRVLHLRRAGAAPASALRGLDAALVSHGHWDHLDLPSLERLGRELPVVCPRGIGKLLRRRKFSHVVEVDEGERVTIGALSVTATFAEHDGSRGPLGVQAPSLGYAIEGSRRVYFAGDTDLFEGMAELGTFDVALVPVSGWGSKVGPGHLDPERAVEAVARLRPKIAIPIHWGTYSTVNRQPTRGHAEEFASLAAKRVPGVEVRIVELAETLELD